MSLNIKPKKNKISKQFVCPEIGFDRTTTSAVNWLLMLLCVCVCALFIYNCLKTIWFGGCGDNRNCIVKCCYSWLLETNNNIDDTFVRASNKSEHSDENQNEITNNDVIATS